MTSSRRISNEPSKRDVENLFGLFKSGKFSEVEKRAQLLLKRNPNALILKNILSAALSKLGKLEAAESLCREIIKANPQYPFAHNNLGLILTDQGREAEAATSFRNAIQLEPKFSEAHNNLGNYLRKKGEYEKSIESYKRALKHKPNMVEAFNNIALAQTSLGRFEDALASCKSALAGAPNSQVAHCNMGNILSKMGQADKAIESYQKALALKADYTDAHNNLGSALQELGRLDESAASFRNALDADSSFAPAHNNLGNVLLSLGKPEEAIVSYRKALDAAPDYAAAHSNLAYAYFEANETDEAIACYEKAYQFEPNAEHDRINAELVLPIIASSREEIERRRSRHAIGRASLKDKDCNAEDPGSKLIYPSFLLSYSDDDNLAAMQELYAGFCAAIPALNYSGPSIGTWPETRQNEVKIRIGFVSEFFRTHTISKLFGGFVGALDRSTFEVVVFHAPRSKLDSVSNDINAAADESFVLSGTLSEQQQTIAEQNLDVLFYPEIGMSAATYFLAFSRLAPVQFVSVGHPETTGMGSIDYFISAASIEPENADQLYSETLICLNQIPCFYTPPIEEMDEETRSSLGLPPSGTLYGCPQTLIKIHPDFDQIMSDILERDPEGHIVLIEGRHRSWSDALRKRWSDSFPELTKRVRFLAPMSQERFLQHLGLMDVLLDPIYFGSGLSFYESMTVGVPTVTWPGPFMRGRIASGAYKQLGVSNPPIVHNRAEYAEFAVGLAHDRERVDALRNDLRNAAKDKLFTDLQAIREFEQFVQAAVEAARSGGKLPRGWMPD